MTIAAFLAATGSAAAQDRANTTPFVANLPYTGDVLSNTSTIDNNSDWLGDIVSNANFIDNNAGATWTGDVESNTQTINNFFGATWFGSVSTAGDLKNFGTWEGDVLSNAEKIENHIGATWEGDVYNNQYKFLNYGTWTGNLYAQASTGELNSYGDWFGDVIGNAGTIYADGIWTGDVQSNSYRIVTNLLDTSSTETKWIGDVLTNDGTIVNYINATWQGDVVDNAGTVSNYSIWNGNLTNRGSVSNIGIWTGDVLNTGSVFRARNQFIGNFDNRGAMQLTGDLAIGGLLSNSGRLQLTYTAGAQTLSVGSAVFDPTSSYEIDVTAAGAADRMLVTGAASLGGTVVVTTSTVGGGNFDTQKAYTIVSAASLDGNFAGVTTDLAYLSAHLSYDTNTVTLGLRRNDVGFADLNGTTGNQVGVGVAVEELGAGNAIYDAILWLSPAEAQNAFDQLSGEAHASLITSSIESANLVGSVATGRIAQAFAKVDSEGSASGHARDAVAAETLAGDSGFWTQFYGAVGIAAAGNSSAGMHSMTGGAAMGLDGMLGDWRLGMMLHAGTTSASVASLNSTSDNTDYGIGVYGGRQWGDTTLSLGVAYTRHDIRSSRGVAFPGFTDALSGTYASGTTQVFGEVSHEFDLGSIAVTPYAGVSYVSHATDGFAETGGAASLDNSANVFNATFTTLGVSADRRFVVGDDRVLTATTSLGWRHAFAGAPVTTHTLTGGTSFSTVGTPVVADMLMFGAGLKLDMGAYNALNLVYDGQAGSNSQTHSLTGTWSTRF